MKFLSTLLMSLVIFTSAMAGVSGPQKVAQMAADEEYLDVIVEEYSSDWEYFEDYNVWICRVRSEDDMVMISFGIIDDELGGHYTDRDLDSDFSWGTVYDANGRGKPFDFAKAEIDIEKRPGNVYNLDAQIVADNGTKVHVKVTPLDVEVRDITVEGKVLEYAAYDEEYNDWYVIFHDEDNFRICLDLINSEEPGRFAGTYSLKDGRKYYSLVRDFAADRTYQFTELYVTTTGVDPLKVCEITGEGMLENGDHISFHMVKLPPFTPKDTVRVDAKVNYIDFQSQMVDNGTCIMAQATDGKVFQVLYPGNIGTFDETLVKDLTGYQDDAKGKFFGIDRGVVTTSCDADLNVKVQAELVCTDSICYVLNLDTKLDVRGSENIQVHDLEVTEFMDMLFMLNGTSTYFPMVGAEVDGRELESGEFADDILYSLATSNGQTVYSIIVLATTIDIDRYGNITLDGSFLGNDMVHYTLHMDHKIPEVVQTLDFTSAEGKLIDIIEDMQAFQIEATSADGSDYIKMLFDAEKVLSGHHSVLSSNYKDECQVIRHKGMANQVIYQMYTCNVDLTVVGPTFTLTGVCQAGDIRFNLDIKGDLAEAGIESDDKDNDLERVFSADEITDFEVNEEAYTFIKAGNDEEIFSTVIYHDTEELEPGVYTIDHSLAPGTVQAGQVTQNYAYYPTYYVRLVPEFGYPTLPFWLCVGGTITVSYDAEGQVQLVVNAVNTWGRKGTILINANADGIKQVAADKTAAKRDGKFLKNHSVVIRSNGRQYNAFGQLMK